MLINTDSKVELAGIEDAKMCPRCNLDTNVGAAHSTRKPPAREGIDSESCDRETQPSQQGYDVEEF